MNCAFDSIPSFSRSFVCSFSFLCEFVQFHRSTACVIAHTLFPPPVWYAASVPLKSTMEFSCDDMFRRAKSTFVFSFTFHIHTSQQRAASEWLMVCAEIWWNFWWFKSQLISHSFYFITFSVCVSISKCNISSSPLSLHFSRHPWHIFIKSSISSQLSFLLYFMWAKRNNSIRTTTKGRTTAA